MSIHPYLSVLSSTVEFWNTSLNIGIHENDRSTEYLGSGLKIRNFVSESKPT